MASGKTEDPIRGAGASTTTISVPITGVFSSTHLRFDLPGTTYSLGPQGRLRSRGIHGQITRIHKVDLRQVGWTKATELAKVARRDAQRFDCATWLHKGRELPKGEFKREVDKHLTGKETEAWEILYLKV